MLKPKVFRVSFPDYWTLKEYEDQYEIDDSGMIDGVVSIRFFDDDSIECGYPLKWDQISKFLKTIYHFNNPISRIKLVPREIQNGSISQSKQLL